MSFLPPNQPLNTCVSQDCEGCPLHERLHCHFKARDLVHFIVIVLPGFLLGGVGIMHFGAQFLIAWVLIAVGFFGLLEVRVMCSHCPHYAEPGMILRCWANHGSPKLWKYRPGPMSGPEKTLFWGGFVLIWGYPVAFLIAGALWYLLAVYALTSAGFFMTLKLFLCSQCVNFACPLNGVDEATRQAFFERNPTIAFAWGLDPKRAP